MPAFGSLRSDLELLGPLIPQRFVHQLNSPQLADYLSRDFQRLFQSPTSLFHLPIQRSIQRYQRRHQMLTPVRNVPPRIRRFGVRARATRHRQKFHSHKFK